MCLSVCVWLKGPEYESRRIGGPPHSPIFEASVHSGDLELAHGCTGSSKKDAEEAAACEAFAALVRMYGDGD